MDSFDKNRLTTVLNNFKGLNIAVIGDMMLDGYIIGDVKRISPEAPVPVVEVEKEFYRFGGAANVANNIAKLGGEPHPIGVIGRDSYGTIFTSLLDELNINSMGLIVDNSRPTTVKTRIIASDQHIVRVDKEEKEYIDEVTETKILHYLESHIDSLDGIILQDYNKGVLTPSLIEKSIKLANKHHKLITVDPKFTNFFSYKGVTVFKPNRKEAGDALGMKIKTEEDVMIAGKKLLELLEAEYVIITLSENGVAIFDRKTDEVKKLPTFAKKVLDVSGAGDTVITTLTFALAAGANILEAALFANHAAAFVCQEVGIIPIEFDKLCDIINNQNESN